MIASEAVASSAVQRTRCSTFAARSAAARPRRDSRSARRPAVGFRRPPRRDCVRRRSLSASYLTSSFSRRQKD